MSRYNSFSKLALYHYQSCAYCALTRSSLGYMDINVELRDIQKNGSFRQELIQGGGKAQVPCLRIEQAGEVTWLYESQDIIRYLQALDVQQKRTA